MERDDRQHGDLQAARRGDALSMWRYAIPLVLLGIIGAFFYRGLSLDPNDVPSALQRTVRDC